MLAPRTFIVQLFNNNFVRGIFQLTVFGLAILLISVLAQPFVAVIVVPIMVIFVWLRQYFVKTSREVKRIEALSKSLLLFHCFVTPLVT